MMVCVIVSVFFPSWSVSSALHPVAAPSSEVENPADLPPFIIESSSAPAVLKLSFRKHLPFLGVGTLTFTSVPASWAKAGIKLGDQVVEFDGRLIYGMSLFHQFGLLLKSKLGPLARKELVSVPIIFGIRSKETGAIRQVKLVVRHGGFTIYSYGF